MYITDSDQSGERGGWGSFFNIPSFLLSTMYILLILLTNGHPLALELAYISMEWLATAPSGARWISI